MKRQRRALAAGVLLVIVCSLLAGVAGTATAASPSLQVSPEVSVTTIATATLTATINGQHPDTVVNFHVLNGPAAGQQTTCTAPANSSVSTCEAIVSSPTPGTSEIRASFGAADLTEGRLANNTATPALGGLLSDPAADCQVADDPDGAGLLGGPQDPCHGGDAAQEGSQAEPDSTDVVRVTWASFSDGRLDCDDDNSGDGEDTAYNNAAQGDRGEKYTCLLTTTAGAAIGGARIDFENVAGVGANSNVVGADVDDFCQTAPDGRCSATVTGGAINGATTICFWAEPEMTKNATYDATGPDIDGGGCAAETVDEAEGNDLTDAVSFDTDVARATGLDVRPEVQFAAPGNRFSAIAVVYDQFRNPFKGNTIVAAELFGGSALDTDGNTPSSPDLTCTTSSSESCTLVTPGQDILGTNLACVWIGQAPPDSAMVGDAQNETPCKGELPIDATANDDKPFPVGDAIDVVRFTIQSRPAIFTVSPNEKRQETSDVLGVDGINFTNPSKITVSGAGVTLGPTSVVSDKRLETTVNLAFDAPPGARDVTVTNRDQGTTTCIGCFRVIGQGYWMVASDGGIFAFGDSRFAGSAGDRNLNKPIAGMAPTPSGLGYWMVATDGGIFAFGDAPFVGSAGGLNLTQPVVGIAAHPSGRGYWLAAADGGVFNFGDAKFYGATGRLPLTRPIVGIAASPTGKGYWLVASDGGIFAFGDAKFFGSTGDIRLNQPIVGMTPTTTGKGYWLVAADGGIFAFGDAKFFGSTGGMSLNRPILGMTVSPLGKGYWLVASDGGIFAFGGARFFGSTGDIKLNRPIVGIARR